MFLQALLEALTFVGFMTGLIAAVWATFRLTAFVIGRERHG